MFFSLFSHVLFFCLIQTKRHISHTNPKNLCTFSNQLAILIPTHFPSSFTDSKVSIFSSFDSVMAKIVATVAVVAAAAAAVVVGHHRSKEGCGKWEKVEEILKVFGEECETSIDKLKSVAEAMVVEMHNGLENEGGSMLKMLISFVDNLPSGFFSLLLLPMFQIHSIFYIYVYVFVFGCLCLCMCFFVHFMFMFLDFVYLFNCFVVEEFMNCCSIFENEYLVDFFCS